MVVAFCPILAEDDGWAFNLKTFAILLYFISRTHSQSLKRSKLHVFFSQLLHLTIGRLHFAAFNRQIQNLSIFGFSSYFLILYIVIIGALFIFDVSIDEIRQQTLEEVRKRKFSVVISIHSSKNRTYIVV